MSNESMDQKPALWITVGVLFFAAGAGLIAWTEMTRSVGESSGMSIGVGGGLIGFGVWSWLRGRLLARSRDEVPPTS